MNNNKGHPLFGKQAKTKYCNSKNLSRHLSLLSRRMSKFKNKSQIENDCNTSSNKMAKVDLNM